MTQLADHHNAMNISLANSPTSVSVNVVTIQVFFSVNFVLFLLYTGKYWLYYGTLEKGVQILKKNTSEGNLDFCEDFGRDSTVTVA